MFKDLKKQLNDLNCKIYKDIKATNCMLCGNAMTSPCNSHTVPQFVLKEIVIKGKVCYGQTLSKVKEIDTEKGVNNAFTFKLICKNVITYFLKNMNQKKAFYILMIFQIKTSFLLQCL